VKLGAACIDKSERRLKMKICFALLATLCMSLALGAEPKLLTTDALTGLPLSPSTDPGMNLSNEPDPLPDTTVCKSKMKGVFYGLYHVTTDAAATWYSAHLPGLKMAKAAGAQNDQIVFYKPDGTVIVIITGQGKGGDARSVAYERYTPGLSEKTIVGIPRGNMVCP
jgi:hypothetical protein